jgi:hypothetical protein
VGRLTGNRRDRAPSGFEKPGAALVPVAVAIGVAACVTCTFGVYDPLRPDVALIRKFEDRGGWVKLRWS